MGNSSGRVVRSSLRVLEFLVRAAALMIGAARGITTELVDMYVMCIDV